MVWGAQSEPQRHPKGPINHLDPRGLILCDGSGHPLRVGTFNSDLGRVGCANDKSSSHCPQPSGLAPHGPPPWSAQPSEAEVCGVLPSLQQVHMCTGLRCATGQQTLCTGKGDNKHLQKVQFCKEAICQGEQKFVRKSKLDGDTMQVLEWLAQRTPEEVICCTVRHDSASFVLSSCAGK